MISSWWIRSSMIGKYRRTTLVSSPYEFHSRCGSLVDLYVHIHTLGGPGNARRYLAVFAVCSYSTHLRFPFLLFASSVLHSPPRPESAATFVRCLVRNDISIPIPMCFQNTEKQTEDRRETVCREILLYGRTESLRSITVKMHK